MIAGPKNVRRKITDALTAFGLLAVTAMLVFYALEDRSHWFILAFAGACALGSIYGFLHGVWPFGIIEAIWAGVATWRWRQEILALLSDEQGGPAGKLIAVGSSYLQAPSLIVHTLTLCINPSVHVGSRDHAQTEREGFDTQ